MNFVPQHRRRVNKVSLAVLAALAGNVFLRIAVPTWTAAAVQKPSLTASTVPFEVGERLTYNVSWKVFDAGIATMTLAEKTSFQNEETYRINATVYSTGIVSALFKVVDVFESFFQARDLCSRRITKKIQEGRRHRETVVTFDAKARRAQMEDRDLNRPDLPAQTNVSPQFRRACRTSSRHSMLSERRPSAWGNWCNFRSTMVDEPTMSRLRSRHRRRSELRRERSKLFDWNLKSLTGCSKARGGCSCG